HGDFSLGIRTFSAWIIILLRGFPEAVSTRLDAVSLESAWTVERAERWWAMHRPLPADARRVAEVLLSQEGRELRIGPRVRPRG
ncbi:MAG TPA: hypothetical protein VGR09_16085, partial [Gemmatimonadales bacterium]|nr:hypothetical protein [Gemmatimonadales bacterium]